MWAKSSALVISDALQVLIVCVYIAVINLLCSVTRLSSRSYPSTICHHTAFLCGWRWLLTAARLGSAIIRSGDPINQRLATVDFICCSTLFVINLTSRREFFTSARSHHDPQSSQC